MMLSSSRLTVSFRLSGALCRGFSSEAHPVIKAAWRCPDTERGPQFSRALRAEKRIPGAVTGRFLLPGQEKYKSMFISVDMEEMRPLLRSKGFFQRVHDLRITNVPGFSDWGQPKHEGELRLTVLPREVHEHTYKVNAIQNFMFQVLGEVPIPGNEPVEKIRMEVQVKVKNAEKCPGVKRGASVMTIFNDIPVTWHCGAEPALAPTHAIVDIEGLNQGVCVKVRDPRVSIPDDTVLIPKPGNHKLEYGLVKISKKLGRD